MKEKYSEHPFGDTGQVILLCLFMVIWGGDSFLMRESTFLSEIVPLYTRLIFLIVALATSFYLVKSGHIAVGPDDGSAGVMYQGAFRYVRHPLYLGSLLFYLGLAVSSASLISLVIFLAAFVFYDYIAGYEEYFMEEKFGGIYRDYKENTGKWVPKLGSNEYCR